MRLRSDFLEVSSQLLRCHLHLRVHNLSVPTHRTDHHVAGSLLWSCSTSLTFVYSWKLGLLTSSQGNEVQALGDSDFAAAAGGLQPGRLLLRHLGCPLPAGEVSRPTVHCVRNRQGLMPKFCEQGSVIWPLVGLPKFRMRMVSIRTPTKTTSSTQPHPIFIWMRSQWRCC